MRNRKRFNTIILTTLIVSVAVALAFGISAAGDKYYKEDIVDKAIAAGSFNTLVTAVKAAGLVETLKGEGPFTVFAPTDEAFGKLPKGTLEDLLKLENKEKLQSILTYHVVPGKALSSDVIKMKSANTANGQAVSIAVKNGFVMVDDAKVVIADIMCSNGLIHVIDSVILPKS
jgi:uncharacterized surface protein with fasciclin (FAS1) repeats